MIGFMGLTPAPTFDAEIDALAVGESLVFADYRSTSSAGRSSRSVGTLRRYASKFSIDWPDGYRDWIESVDDVKAVIARYMRGRS